MNLKNVLAASGALRVTGVNYCMYKVLTVKMAVIFANEVLILCQ